MIYPNILATIGRTPIVRINRIAPPQVEMYVKCEFFNPLHSVKDRLAIAIIEDAEASGTLKPGQTVVEATSGNTGIALAMVCAAKGYPFVAVMVETFSIERRKVMRLLGAKVILTPAAERGSGMVRKAAELAAKHDWFLARQFENPANPAYHRNTTGPEILSDFAGRRLDYFVSGWGTGGTLTGVGEMLKLARPKVKIIATEPENAALLSGKPFAPHKIQGWTPDFVLKSIEPMNESLKSTGTKKLNKKATTQWDKAAKSYKNYINYIDKKADRFELTLIDLLYISNFKGGNATINEAELELKNKLIAYSTELRTLDSKFGTRKLTNLNDDELNELIEKVHSICSLTRKTNVNKIDGFSISYLSALLNVYFPNLLPILDRRVLINFDIVTNGDINKQGQIIDIERFYDKLIIKMRDKARLENKSIRQIDKELFIIEIPKEKTDSENED